MEVTESGNDCSNDLRKCDDVTDQGKWVKCE